MNKQPDGAEPTALEDYVPMPVFLALMNEQEERTRNLEERLALLTIRAIEHIQSQDAQPHTIQTDDATMKVGALP